MDKWFTYDSRVMLNALVYNQPVYENSQWMLFVATTQHTLHMWVSQGFDRWLVKSLNLVRFGDMGFDSQEPSQIVFDFRDSRAFLVWFLGA